MVNQTKVALLLHERKIRFLIQDLKLDTLAWTETFLIG